MKRQLVVIIMSSLSLLSVSVDLMAGGGAQGNGKRYSSRLYGFEIEYPQDWIHFDIEQTVSFLESEDADTRGSIVSVQCQNQPAVQSLDDLKKYLEQIYPNLPFEKIEFNGKEAIQGEKRAQGILSVYRGEGEILTVHYRARNGADAREEVKEIVESLVIE